MCRLTLAWISSEISTKLLGMRTHLDRSFLTALDPISYQLVSQLSGVDWPLASPFANCFLPVSLSNSSLVPCLLPVTSRSWVQAFVWFRAKTDKGIICLTDHLHRVTIVYSFNLKLPLSEVLTNIFSGVLLGLYFPWDELIERISGKFIKASNKRFSGLHSMDRPPKPSKLYHGYSTEIRPNFKQNLPRQFLLLNKMSH